MFLNNDNYFSTEAAQNYWSVSQFKAFDKCEAAGLAESRGEYFREKTDALLIGSYIDAYFSGELRQFEEREGAQMFKKNGDIYQKYEHANDIISYIESDPLMIDYLTGEHQTIMSADLFGVPWKCTFDVYDEKRIVDLKIVKDFEDIFEPGFGYRSWIEFWRYDVQGAIYTKIEQLVTGRDKPLPFYIVAATKEKTPDKAVIHIPQHILDAALAMVEAKIDRFDLIKSGDVEPRRCEKCDYCKATKILKAPEEYEIQEADD
jgi:hypothetical protein